MTSFIRSNISSQLQKQVLWFVQWLIFSFFNGNWLIFSKRINIIGSPFLFIVQSKIQTLTIKLSKCNWTFCSVHYPYDFSDNWLSSVIYLLIFYLIIMRAIYSWNYFYCYYTLQRCPCLQIPYGWWRQDCNYKHLNIILQDILVFLVIYASLNSLSTYVV